ncbi:MAG: KEOPS complex subunit Pcc1 [Candidatus Bathyarchaeia archaeon]|jgi:tRNA threonylcarbamoyladenosine modification (KEOPS) complex  Pcc1 subunit
MSATAKLSIQLNSRRLADSIAKSLSPEIDHPTGSKSRVRVHVEQRRLELTFLARDATALRATMNSYLRMIGACLKVTEAIENAT